jgi:Bacterial PH domain
MGSNLLSVFTGNTVQIDVDNKIVHELIDEYLCEGERVTFAFKYFRDMILFTTHRYIFVNLQKKSGAKIERSFTPWKYLVSFTTENVGGFMDGDHDIVLNFAHVGVIPFQINANVELPPITRFLSQVQFNNL